MSTFFPAAEASGFYRLMALPVRALHHLIQHVEVTGAHNIPASGPAIIVANHTAHLDAITVGAAVYEAGRAASFAAASDFFELPVLGHVLRAIDAVAVYRGSDRAKDAVADIGEACRQGRVLLLFPEGSFTRDPQVWPMKAKTGIARIMAAFPDVPVIPLAHWGNERLLDPWDHSVSWSNLVRRDTRVSVSVGQPLELTVSPDASYADLVAASEAVMQAIEDLLIPLRQANPNGFDTTPRERRWDVALDGDPQQESHERNVSSRERTKQRWARLQQMASRRRR